MVWGDPEPPKDGVDGWWIRLDSPWLCWVVYEPICAQEMGSTTQICIDTHTHTHTHTHIYWLNE